MNDKLDPEDVLVLPDWAPKDAGAVLFRDGNWVTIQDYEINTRKPRTIVVHMCTGGEWRPRKRPPQLIQNHCNTCKAKAPDRVVGFNALARWDR